MKETGKPSSDTAFPRLRKFGLRIGGSDDKARCNWEMAVE